MKKAGGCRPFASRARDARGQGAYGAEAADAGIAADGDDALTPSDDGSGDAIGVGGDRRGRIGRRRRDDRRRLAGGRRGRGRSAAAARSAAPRC